MFEQYLKSGSNDRMINIKKEILKYYSVSIPELGQ